MPKLKPEETEQRRKEIVDAARACFLRSGFHQTTTDEICREGSITPGGLYHYFGSKDEIISAVIQDRTQDTIQNLKAAVEGSRDVRGAVEALSTLFFQWLHDPDLDNATRLDIEIWGESLRNDTLASIARESWSMRRRWLEWIIGRGKEEGYYTPQVDPAGLADLIMAMFDGLRLSRLLWGEDFNVDAALQSLVLMSGGQLVEAPQQNNGASD